MIAKWDLGKLSEAHRRMVLGVQLAMYGTQADVYVPVTFPNGFEATWPEYTLNAEPLMSTTVLIKQPLTGFRMGQALLDNFVSLADKVDDVIEIYCLDELQIDYQLNCHVGDGKLLTLRIMENDLSYNPTAQGYIYKAMVM
jgi:hypothetical protein